MCDDLFWPREGPLLRVWNILLDFQTLLRIPRRVSLPLSPFLSFETSRRREGNSDRGTESLEGDTSLSILAREGPRDPIRYPSVATHPARLASSRVTHEPRFDCRVSRP